MKKTGSFLSSRAGKITAALLAAAGIILLAAGSLIGKNTQSGAAAAAPCDSYAQYREYLENRIKTLCESVAGVSDAAVLITLDGSIGYTYCAGELSAVSYPAVRGIAVVCRGGDNLQVQKKLIDLLSAAFSVSSAHISVAGAGSNYTDTSG